MFSKTGEKRLIKGLKPKVKGEGWWGEVGRLIAPPRNVRESPRGCFVMAPHLTSAFLDILKVGTN